MEYYVGGDSLQKSKIISALHTGPGSCLPAVFLGRLLSTAGLLLASLDLRQQLVDQERLLGNQAGELAHLTDWGEENIIYYAQISLSLSLSNILIYLHR